mgnify:CR=1 FL=1
MSLMQRALLGLAGVTLAFGDVWVVANTSPGVLSWMKIALAFSIQVALLVGLALHFSDRSAVDERVEAVPPLRERATPLILFILFGGLSASLLYNGIKCGDKSLPVKRGAPICEAR